LAGASADAEAARPDDIAQVVAMLFTSDYLTGEIVIAGG
jgi:hypothetical protein